MRPGLYPERPVRKIDYDLMNKEHPRLKAALTRAKNSGDPIRVAEAVDKALDVWAKVGCWPDDWPLWRNALEDAWHQFTRSDAYDDDLYDNGGVLIRKFQAVGAKMDV